MAIEISSTDVANAETFLETLLTENVEDGRFTQGTALRDLCIKAFAFIFAHISKENQQVRSVQSLLNVRNVAITDPDTDRLVSDSIDAIMSNWFITRKTGGFSRGVVNINVNRRQDYIIPGNNRFLYDRARAFFPDVVDPSQPIIIRANDLLAVVQPTGGISEYQFQLRVVSARTGSVYDVTPATWEGGRQFSSFVTRIFSTTKFSGGRDRETTEEIVERSGTAIAVRNLINERSIDATLRDRFSNIRRLFVRGMGDPEMQRDLRTDLGSGIQLHLGGHFDVYLELPRTVVTFEGQVGGSFTRPDNTPHVLRDGTVSDWTAETIQPGDILRITAGLPDVPRDFIIKEIYETELRVSEKTPFSAATDTEGTFVDYYIYRPIFGPDVQMLPPAGVNATGQTSAAIQTANRITLPGGAHYDILDVAVIDPDPGDPNIDPGDGFVHFPVRTNATPNLVISADYLEYQVINRDPGTAQSQIQFEEIEVEPTYNDKTLRVRYETLVGLDAIHSYTRDRFHRMLAGNILARGFFPVYISCNVPYRLKPGATNTVDESALSTAVAEFINNFSPTDIIDVSDITQVVRNADTNIGTIYAFQITYKLIAPNGRVIPYVTGDVVDLDPDKIYVDPDDSNPVDLDNPASLSLSDRTVRYMSSPSRITFEERT